MSKQDLRQYALSERRKWATCFSQWNRKLCKHLLQCIRTLPEQWTSIGGYWPLSNEADIRTALHALHTCDYTLSLPVVLRSHAPLIFREWTPQTPLERGPFSTQHPSPTQPLIHPDILCVPLVAFTASGQRLGYGGGFYDRTIEHMKKDGTLQQTIGIAFSVQELTEIPTEKTDQALDWICTEKGIIQCGSGQKALPNAAKTNT